MGADRTSLEQQSISWAEAAGIAHAGAHNWDRVRYQQLSELLRLFPISIAANVFNSILVAAALYPTFKSGIIFWAACVLSLSAISVIKRTKKTVGVKTLSTSRKVIIQQTFRACLLGLIWSALPIFFFADATETQRIIIIAVVAGIMAGATLLFSTLVSAGFVYLGLMGIGSMWAATCIQSPTFFLLSIVYTASLMLGVWSNGEIFVRNALIRAEVIDQNQVISLLLREVEDNDADWLWQTDANLILSRVSTRMARCAEKTEAELLGAPFFDILINQLTEKSKSLPATIKKINKCFQQRKSFSDVIVPVSINGTSRWWSLSANPIFDEADKFIGYRGVGSDITKLRQSEEKIAYMARYDALTGLPNRTMVHDTLAEQLQRAIRLSSNATLMFLDLDRFKTVNDTLGHPLGDRLLCIVADRLRAVVGNSGMLGRIGGDEFAIVISEKETPANIMALAEHIIEETSQPYEISGHNIVIGVSVGLATGPTDGTSVDVLLRNADLALYHAKNNGRGTYCKYDSTMHAEAEERRQIEVQLRDAINRNLLMLHYQPIFSADGATINGFEALLRWQHPELGDIPPTKFVPIAEEAGLINIIGEWVIRTACHTASTWPEHVKVSVNLSPIQFNNPNLTTVVMNALAQSQIAPERLELEITEGVFLMENATTSLILGQLQALGVGIALDDFGTGYSSLGYLRKANFTTIKIDRSFVHGTIAGQGENSAIIRAIVAMADSLEITTTAEGAENQADLDAVRALGCKQVQGFVYGRPMPADEALALFDTARARAAA
jgi:diguanylate cyclase (GGDEF)-like protein/PAS domain S-box-containing protein